MKKVLLIGMAFTLLILGCRKDNITTEVDYVTESDEPIDTRLSGQVIDENGLPIEEASVRVGNETLVTNEDGIFSFSKISIDLEGSLAVIEKNGFYTNFKRILPSENETFVKFGLTPKTTSTGSFLATEGGVISRQGKERITFEPNSIVDESGNSYNGEVTVFSDYFNIDKPYLGEMMPGDLTGLNTEGTKVQLKTYSMVAVELFGENGEELNLKEGTTANIEFPLSLQTSNPPQKIALWSLDENTGLWVEEGVATYDGNVYQGEVTHFSFWNCDAPFPLINLFGTIGDFDGNVLPHFKINIQTEDSGLVRSGYTNSSGLFHGKVPANQLLLIQLLDNCGTVVYQEKIGPFSETTVLPHIKVEIIENIIQITGKVEGCNGEVVTNGYVTITDDSGKSNFFLTESDGSFDIKFVHCETENFSVKGMDAESLVESPVFTFENTGQLTEDVGSLITCNLPSEFYILEADGKTYSIPGMKGSIYSTHIQFDNYGSISPDIMNVSLVFDPPSSNDLFPEQVYFGGTTFPGVIGCSDFTSGTDRCSPHFSINFTKTENFIGGLWEGAGEGFLWLNSQQIPAKITFKTRVKFGNIRIRGKLWQDTNKNGLQDMGEPPFRSGTIRVDYINSFGDPSNLQSSVQNDGNFSISAPADILLNISIQGLPADYSLTLQDVGTDENIDSDFDPMTLSIPDVEAVPGSILYFDAGIIEN